MNSAGRAFARWSARWGRALTIVAGGAVIPCRGFLQPLRYKNKTYLENEYLPGGLSDTGHFFYIGPPSPRLDRIDGALVRDGENAYTVKRAECVYLGREPLYLWAVLRPFVEEDNP